MPPGRHTRCHPPPPPLPPPPPPPPPPQSEPTRHPHSSVINSRSIFWSQWPPRIPCAKRVMSSPTLDPFDPLPGLNTFLQSCCRATGSTARDLSVSETLPSGI